VLFLKDNLYESSELNHGRTSGTTREVSWYTRNFLVLVSSCHWSKKLFSSEKSVLLLMLSCNVK